jgi:hypothetical protein
MPRDAPLRIRMSATKGMAAAMASNGSHLHLGPGGNVGAVLDEPVVLNPRNLE